VHRALTYALRWGVVARNVAEAVEPPRVPVRELAPFTPEEIARLLSAIRGHRHERLWITMLATGMRFGEAAALRWADVDLEGRVIHVRHTLGPKGKHAGPRFAQPKTYKGRRDLPLPAVVVKVLRLQLASTRLEREHVPGWHDLDLVFPSALGTPLNESHVLARFQRASRRPACRSGACMTCGTPTRRACSPSGSTRGPCRTCWGTAASRSQ
jgi:integrase